MPRRDYARGRIVAAATIVAWFGTGQNAARALAPWADPDDPPWPDPARLAGAFFGGYARADRSVGPVEATAVGRAWDAYRAATCIDGLDPDAAYLPPVAVPPERRNARIFGAPVDPALVAWARATFGTLRNVAARLGVPTRPRVIHDGRVDPVFPPAFTRAMRGASVDDTVRRYVHNQAVGFAAAFLRHPTPWKDS